MNRIKPSWVGSICLTILLFLLCACSTTTGNQTTSAQTGAGATGATAVEEQIAQAVFQAINQSRAANGLTPLTWSTALANSARQHDLAMQAANTLSHQLPGEAALGDQSISRCQWTHSLDVEHRPGQQCEATRSCHASSKHLVPPAARRGSSGRSRKTTGGQLVMGSGEYWRNQRSKRQWCAGSSSSHDERTAAR